MINKTYRTQVDLLLEVLPFIAQEKVFALKGGTAINLFIRDMPRLSVDIDLTYLLFDSRKKALENISKTLNRIKSAVELNIPHIKIHSVKVGGSVLKLNCQRQNAQIKIEVNSVTRGHIYPPKLRQIADSVQDEFGKFVAINVVSFAELYGGKICAALDRQHPRDLFDVKLLMENEGFNDAVWNGVKLGLISHYKPIGELLFPIFKNQKSAFVNQFKGMSKIEFNYSDYIKTRQKLIETIGKRLTKNDKEFFISFEEGNPNWDLLSINRADKLPAVEWKLLNIRKLRNDNEKKHRQSIEKLRASFS